MKQKFKILLDWNSLQPDIEAIDKWLYEEFPMIWSIDLIQKFNKNKLMSIQNNQILLLLPTSSRMTIYLDKEYFWTFVDKYKHYVCLYLVDNKNKIVKIKHILSVRKSIIN